MFNSKEFMLCRSAFLKTLRVPVAVLFGFLLSACGGGGGGGGGAAPVPPAPNSTFTTQPTSATVTAPATAVFNVVATGTPAPTLQWQLSTDGGGTWGNIAGATASNYTTPATVRGDSVKLYRAVATNSTGAVNSNAASLTLRSIALPKTGQTMCYDVAGSPLASCLGTGQDGELQTGVAEPAPRFVVGAGVGTTDQCVTDNLTGLMWMRSPPNVFRAWQQALDYANALNLCGFTDWRLPNHKELRSLINHNVANNVVTLNTLGFINVPNGNYWSSSSSADSPANAWYVIISSGDASTIVKTFPVTFVWPVRAGR